MSLIDFEYLVYFGLDGRTNVVGHAITNYLFVGT